MWLIVYFFQMVFYLLMRPFHPGDFFFSVLLLHLLFFKLFGHTTWHVGS